MEAESPQEPGLIETLAAGVAHEVRNPLNSVQINLGILEQELSELVGDRHAHVFAVLAKIAAEIKRRLEVSVSDDGEGMSPETREEAFTPFFTTREEGTGLGLALVRRIVEQHGGSVEVSSTVGEGTTVTLVFPEPAGS